MEEDTSRPCENENCLNTLENLRMLTVRIQEAAQERQLVDQYKKENELLGYKLAECERMIGELKSSQETLVNKAETTSSELLRVESEKDIYKARVQDLMDKAKESEKHLAKANEYADKYEQMGLAADKLLGQLNELQTKYEKTVALLNQVEKKSSQNKERADTTKRNYDELKTKQKHLEKYLNSAIELIDNLASSVNLSTLSVETNDLVKTFRKDEVRVFFNTGPWNADKGASTSEFVQPAIQKDISMRNDEDFGLTLSDDDDDDDANKLEQLMNKGSPVKKKTNIQKDTSSSKSGSNIDSKLDELKTRSNRGKVSVDKIGKWPEGIKKPLPESVKGTKLDYGVICPRSVHKKTIPNMRTHQHDFDKINEAARNRTKELLDRGEGSSTDEVTIGTQSILKPGAATILGKKGKTVRELQSEMMKKVSVKEMAARLKAEEGNKNIEKEIKKTNVQEEDDPIPTEASSVEDNIMPVLEKMPPETVTEKCEPISADISSRSRPRTRSRSVFVQMTPNKEETSKKMSSRDSSCSTGAGLRRSSRLSSVSSVGNTPQKGDQPVEKIRCQSVHQNTQKSPAANRKRLASVSSTSTVNSTRGQRQLQRENRRSYFEKEEEQTLEADVESQTEKRKKSNEAAKIDSLRGSRSRSIASVSTRRKTESAKEEKEEEKKEKAAERNDGPASRLRTRKSQTLSESSQEITKESDKNEKDEIRSEILEEVNLELIHVDDQPAEEPIRTHEDILENVAEVGETKTKSTTVEKKDEQPTSSTSAIKEQQNEQISTEVARKEITEKPKQPVTNLRRSSARVAAIITDSGPPSRVSRIGRMVAPKKVSKPETDIVESKRTGVKRAGSPELRKEESKMARKETVNEEESNDEEEGVLVIDEVDEVEEVKQDSLKPQLDSQNIENPIDVPLAIDDICEDSQIPTKPDETVDVEEKAISSDDDDTEDELRIDIDSEENEEEPKENTTKEKEREEEATRIIPPVEIVVNATPTIPIKIKTAEVVNYSRKSISERQAALGLDISDSEDEPEEAEKIDDSKKEEEEGKQKEKEEGPSKQKEIEIKKGIVKKVEKKDNKVILIEPVAKTRRGAKKEVKKPTGMKEALKSKTDKSAVLKAQFRQALDLKLPVQELKRPMEERGYILEGSIPLSPEDAVDIMIDVLKQNSHSDMWMVLLRHKSEGNINQLINNDEQNFLNVSVSLNDDDQELLKVFIRRILFEFSFGSNLSSPICGSYSRLFCHSIHFVVAEIEEKQKWMRKLIELVFLKHETQAMKCISYCLNSDAAEHCKWIIEEIENKTEFSYVFKHFLHLEPDQCSIVNWLINFKFQEPYIVQLGPKEITQETKKIYENYSENCKIEVIDAQVVQNNEQSNIWLKKSKILAKTGDSELLQFIFDELKEQMTRMENVFLKEIDTEKTRSIFEDASFSENTISSRQAEIMLIKVQWIRDMLSIFIDNSHNLHCKTILSALAQISSKIVDLKEETKKPNVDKIDKNGLIIVQKVVSEMSDFISEFTSYPLQKGELAKKA